MNHVLRTFILLCIIATKVFAQQMAQNDQNNPAPLSSEFNILRLEQVNRIIRGESPDGKRTILIARLGNSEYSRELNSRRLFNVQTFLARDNAKDAENIIVAEGKKSRGYGRVEIYVGGKLMTILTALKNHDLEVDCCEGNTDFYPNKDRLRRSNKMRKQ